MEKKSQEVRPVDSHQALKIEMKYENSNNPQVLEKEIVRVGYHRLFRLADKTDVILMVIGIFCSMVTGAGTPVLFILFGKITDTYTSNSASQSLYSLYNFFYAAAIIFVMGWLSHTCWTTTAARQCTALRSKVFRALLLQEVPWFEANNQQSLIGKTALNTAIFSHSLGSSISSLLTTVFFILAGIIICFLKGWLMAVVVISVVPLLALAGMYRVYVSLRLRIGVILLTIESDGIASQALRSIKTIKSLCGEDFEVDRYDKCLETITNEINQLKMREAVSAGLESFFKLGIYALALYWGAKLIEQHEPNHLSSAGYYTTGDVMAILFNAAAIGTYFNKVPTLIANLKEAKQSAEYLFALLDRKPAMRGQGHKISNLKGIFQFKNVSFAYPSAPGHQVLKNLSFTIDCSKAAIVGPSGCGKSTIMQLLMRFYDPDEGEITLDGVNLRELDIEWLRENIGYVGQEPYIFNQSVRSNLLLSKYDATEKQLQEALKAAEAYDFVMELSQKLDSNVGYAGGLLSGGQKQRIAIARVLLRKPKILLLDEATSALDRTNEVLIQNTLDRIVTDCISITVAHRLQTIKNCQMIFVLDQGRVREQGPYHQLEYLRTHQVALESPEETGEQPSLGLKDEPAASLEIHGQGKDTKGKPEGEKADGGTSKETSEKNEDQIKLGSQENKEAIKGEQEKAQEPQETKKAAPILTNEQMMKEHMKELKQRYSGQVLKRLFRLTEGNRLRLFFGYLFAILLGFVTPVYSVFLGKIMFLYFGLEARSSNLEYRDKAYSYALAFLIIGVISFLLKFLQQVLLGLFGEDRVKAKKVELFAKCLRLPIPWFDRKINDPNLVATQISDKTKAIYGILTNTIPSILETVSCCVAGLSIALAYEWRTALVSIGLLPLTLIIGLVQSKVTQKVSQITSTAYSSCLMILAEVVMQIKTVSSFGSDNWLLRKHDQLLEEPYLALKNQAIKLGFLSGLDQGVRYIITGLVYFLGAVFLRSNVETIQPDNVFIAIYAITLSGLVVGTLNSNFSEFGEASASAFRIFELEDEVDENMQQEVQGSKMLKSGLPGKIELREVVFKYESRNDYVLKKFKAFIAEAEKIGFVGKSGCGKSTIVQLLLRFYEPEKGLILINNIDIRDFELQYLRRHFGAVFQEPKLFKGTFEQNIRYNTGASKEEIREAASLANALTFIEGDEAIEGNGGDAPQVFVNNRHLVKDLLEKVKRALEPDEKGIGFEKDVGYEGGQISGGQKQRVAIARIVLRKPHILLLDEATSALDSRSQNLVQQALDKLMQGRTTLIIAHRLETIKASDRIYAMDNGEIIEEGSFDNLISKKGYFYDLTHGQAFKSS